MKKVPCYACGKDVRTSELPIIWPAIRPPYRLTFCSLDCLSKVDMRDISDRDDDNGPWAA